MNGDLTGLAFAAGMVAAFNPCGFAMLPAYLTLVVRREESRGSGALGRFGPLGRAAAATATMTLGFLAVFGLFGLLTVSVASAVQQYLPYVTLVVGVALMALGGWLISGRELAVRSMAGGARWTPTARLGSMFGYGVGYAIASLSCTVGPFLAVTGSSLRSGSIVGATGVYLAYAAGFGLVVGVLAVAVAAASTALVERMRRVLPYVSRISGVVLVTVGAYVAYYGWFEVRLFGSGAGADDPVIAGAGRVQRALAGWVYAHGAWPWLVALGVVVAAVGATAWTRRRDRRREHSAALDSGV